MVQERKFFKCAACGTVVGIISDGGGELVCCGEPMQHLNPNTVDAASEKHLPAASCADGTLTVQIGEVPHPMTKEHYIEWIYVETARGGQRYSFEPGEEPNVKLCVCDCSPIAVYAYCNLHGLWVTRI